MDLQAQLEELKETTQAKLAEMHGDHAKELQELRVQVLGKKGSLTELLKGLKELSHDMRPVVGKQVNEVRDVLTKAFEEQAKIENLCCSGLYEVSKSASHGLYTSVKYITHEGLVSRK